MAGISASGREELASMLGRGARLVTVDEVSSALSGSRTASAKRLARWASLGWLRRVRRGLYLPVPLEVENPAEWTEDARYLADAVWAPCYFTGWTTANHWDFTERVFRTTIVKTTQRVRRSTGQLAGHDYLLAHAQPKELTWGLKTEWRHDRRLRLADPARTVIDVLVDLSLSGGIRLAAEILESYLLDHPGDVLIDRLPRSGRCVASGHSMSMSSRRTTCTRTQSRAVTDNTVDERWKAPRTMTSWRTGASLELIRFAGANRLKVEIDYRAERGLRGSRLVEPYSLRHSHDGDLLLFVLNDHHQLRSYRVDRIAGVNVTRQSFAPKFVVEF